MAQKPNKRHSCCVKNGEGSTRFPNEGAIWCCSLKLFVRIDAKCKSFAINVLGMYAISYFLARKYLCVLRLGSNRSKVKLSRSLALPLPLLPPCSTEISVWRARSKRSSDCTIAVANGRWRSDEPFHPLQSTPSGERAHLGGGGGGALPHSRECVPTFLTVGTDSLIIHHELLRPPGGGGGPAEVYYYMECSGCIGLGSAG